MFNSEGGEEEAEYINERGGLKEGQKGKSLPLHFIFCPAIVHAIYCLDGSTILCFACNQCAGKSHHLGPLLLVSFDVLAYLGQPHIACFGESVEMSVFCPNRVF